MSVSLGSLIARWPDLDDRPPELFHLGPALDGVLPFGTGQVGALAGGPGAGKSALGLQMVTEAVLADGQLAAVIQNIEMAPGRLVERLVARLSGVPIGALRSPAAGQAAAVREALGRLAGAGDRVHFVTSDAVEDAVEAANAARARVLLIDYVQRVRLHTSRRSDPREVVNEVVVWARRLALEGAAVLLVSSVGKATKYRNLGLSAFRDTSELEYGVDFAAILEAPDGVEHPARELNVCKNRYGPTRTVSLVFDAERMAFPAAGGAEAAPADPWDDEEDDS